MKNKLMALGLVGIISLSGCETGMVGGRSNIGIERYENFAWTSDWYKDQDGEMKRKFTLYGRSMPDGSTLYEIPPEPYIQKVMKNSIVKRMPPSKIHYRSDGSVANIVYIKEFKDGNCEIGYREQ